MGRTWPGKRYERRFVNKNPSWGCNGYHFGRRDFLRIGSLSFLGIGLSQYLALKNAMAAAGRIDQKAKTQSCILLWLDGGPSQIDTWDPKPNSSFKPISTNVSGIEISESLPQLAQQMDKLAIIRSLHTEENDHSQGSHYAATGHRPNPAMKFPSFGAIVTKEMGPRNSIPPYVMVPPMPKGVRFDEHFKGHFIGTEYDPMIIPDPGQENFKVPDLSLPQSLSMKALEDRRSFLRIVDNLYRQKVQIAEFSHMDVFVEQAWNILLSPAVREAFDLSKESEKTKDAYGRDSAGQSLLLARRLVEAGSRMVTAGGYKSQAWDTHNDNDKRHREDLAPNLDRSFSALLEDLDQRGLLESTVVIVLGEFGRSPHLNPALGRDHWPQCWSTILGGGGIQGGQVIGASDERGAYVAERMVSIGDIFATIYKAFGIDWRREYMHPIGRPIKIANALKDTTGKPIQELI